MKDVDEESNNKITQKAIGFLSNLGSGVMSYFVDEDLDDFVFEDSKDLDGDITLGQRKIVLSQLLGFINTQIESLDELSSEFDSYRIILQDKKKNIKELSTSIQRTE